MVEPWPGGTVPVMPKKLERRLRRKARELYPGDEEAQDRYVYGTMNNMGLMPHHQKKPKEESKK